MPFTFRQAALVSASLTTLLLAAPASAQSESRTKSAKAAQAAATKTHKATGAQAKTVVTRTVVTKTVTTRTVSAKAKMTPGKETPLRQQAKQPVPTTRLASVPPRRAPQVDYTPVGSLGTFGGSWLVTINGKARVSTKYLGAEKYGFMAWPTVSFRRPGAPVMWSSPDDSISFRAVESGRFAFGPTLAYRAGRYNSNAPELRGVHKPQWTVEAGAFADLWLAPDMLRLRAEARRGLRESDGFVADFGADWVMRFGAFTFAAGPRAKWGNDRFMRDRFGVTQADNAANPNYAVYTPKNAFYALGGYGSASYKQDDNWTYTLHGGYDRLSGDAGKSPVVVQSGSKNQWNLGAVVSYTFEWK